DTKRVSPFDILIGRVGGGVAPHPLRLIRHVMLQVLLTPRPGAETRVRAGQSTSVEASEILLAISSSARLMGCRRALSSSDLKCGMPLACSLFHSSANSPERIRLRISAIRSRTDWGRIESLWLSSPYWAVWEW